MAVAGITKMTTNAVEESTYVLEVEFLDAAGEQVIPTSAQWTLYGSDNVSIVNNRQDVPLVGSTIVLTGADLELPVASQNIRRVLIEATYNSATYGNNLSFRHEILFAITNLRTIS